MKRYFFNIRGDGYEETDLIGRKCRNEVAALSEAMAMASSIVHDRMAVLHVAHLGSIEVEDEQHRPVLSLPLRAAAY